MSELVVVIAVCALSVVLTGFHARSSSRFGAIPHDLERMLAAVQRATADFLWQETRLLVALVGVVLVAMAALASLALGVERARGAPLVWAIGALCSGALGGAAIAHAAQWSAARSARASLEALRQDRTRGVLVTLRAASGLAVFIDAASALLATAAFAAHYVYLAGALRMEPHQAAVLASRTLASLSLGALCAAVVFQVGGASLHTAAGVAATGARARHPSIARDEEQNPVLVAELVGDHAGGIVSRSADTFAGFLLGNAGVVMLAALVNAREPGSPERVLALVSLPLVIRALGQFAASVTLASARFEGHPGPLGVLLAARTAHALILIAGLFGAALWLLGTPSFLAFGCAGSLGVLAGLLSAAASARSVRLRENGEGSGPAPAELGVPRAIGLGLQRTWVLFLLVGGCLGGAWLVGARTGVPHGGVLALTVAVAALLGGGTFNACECTFAMIGENVRRIAGLRRAGFDARARRGVVELDRSGVAIGHLGRTETILGAAAAASLAAVMLPLTGAARAGAEAPISLHHPFVILSGVLGAGALLFHVGGVLRTSSRAAASLDRALSDRLAQGDGESAQRPGPLPGYRESVQLASAGATQKLLPLALGAVLTPFGVAVVLRLIYGSAGGGSIVHGLTALSALAALTGSHTALVAQGSSVELSRARRAGAEGLSHTNPAIEFMERCIGPAALLGLKATAVSSLAVVPLLF